MEENTVLDLDVYMNLCQVSRRKLHIFIQMLNVNLE